MLKARPGKDKLDNKERGRSAYNTGSDLVNVPKLHQSFKKSTVGLTEEVEKRKGAPLNGQGKKKIKK
jgi:hypothetical protein